ncbi:MAG: hypothetical protein AABX66_03670 [Nanoarchaeota archaeon]
MKSLRLSLLVPTVILLTVGSVNRPSSESYELGKKRGVNEEKTRVSGLISHSLSNIAMVAARRVYSLDPKKDTNFHGFSNSFEAETYLQSASTRWAEEGGWDLVDKPETILAIEAMKEYRLARKIQIEIDK